MRRVTVASDAGFCFGVGRAVTMAESALAADGGVDGTGTGDTRTGSESDSGAVGGTFVYALGEIIHNGDEVRRLEALGLRTVHDADEIPRGAAVVIRSHGAARETYERLRQRGASLIDATCPKVRRTHRIAERASREGKTVVIIGEETHPEIIALRGWCGSSLVVRDANKLEEWLNEENNREKDLAIVVQTTQNSVILDECAEVIKKLCTKAKVFDTICNATFLRQNEARKLAAASDAMIVIGGRNSANSAHLAEICAEYCGNVQFVENASEIDFRPLSTAEEIGITAGASTPAWIIKEVKRKMTEEIRDTEMNLEELQEMAADEEAVTAEVVETEVPGVTDTNEIVEIEEPEQIAEETEISETEQVLETQDAPDAEGEAEKSFAELLGDSIKTINNGDTVVGVVAAITATEISVDLKTKHSGYIPLSEFSIAPDANIDDVVKVGDEIEAYVVRVNDVEGTAMLSKRRLDVVKGWEDIEQAQADGTVIEGTVSEDNKGGVVVNVSGVRVFVPASQTGLGRDVPMAELLHQKVRMRITEVNRSRRRVVGSIRNVQMAERRELADKIWESIEEGKYYQGKVKSLTTFGAFVDIGGLDGLVHISQLSWNRIKQPSDVVSIGDEIDVYVIGFDREARKISLGYKDPEANPWRRFSEAYQVDDIASVKVVKLMAFGAFAEVMPGVDGLIHISQIAGRRIEHPSEALTVGDIVNVRITHIDYDKQKISLSIRALLDPEPAPQYVDRNNDEPVQSSRSNNNEPEADALVYEVSASGIATGNAPEESETEE